MLVTRAVKKKTANIDGFEAKSRTAAAAIKTKESLSIGAMQLQ